MRKFLKVTILIIAILIIGFTTTITKKEYKSNEDELVNLEEIISNITFYLNENQIPFTLKSEIIEEALSVKDGLIEGGFIISIENDIFCSEIVLINVNEYINTKEHIEDLKKVRDSIHLRTAKNIRKTNDISEKIIIAEAIAEQRNNLIYSIVISDKSLAKDIYKIINKYTHIL